MVVSAIHQGESAITVCVCMCVCMCVCVCVCVCVGMEKWERSINFISFCLFVLFLLNFVGFREKNKIRGTYACMLSHVQLCDPMDCIALQTLLSMWFSRQEYWSGLPFPPPGDLSIPGIEPKYPASPALQADYLLLSHQGSPKVDLIFLKKQSEAMCSQRSV